MLVNASFNIISSWGPTFLRSCSETRKTRLVDETKLRILEAMGRFRTLGTNNWTGLRISLKTVAQRIITPAENKVFINRQKILFHGEVLIPCQERTAQLVKVLPRWWFTIYLDRARIWNNQIKNRSHHEIWYKQPWWNFIKNQEHDTNLPSFTLESAYALLSPLGSHGLSPNQV